MKGTKMTEPTPATVAVPVELLERLMESAGSFDDRDEPAVQEARALLPKPKSRLVAVERDTWIHQADNAWFDDQPDLLTLLDGAVDEVMSVTDWPRVRAALKARIRTELGVTDD